MAEYVEQRMEEMIPEVEELERVGLLESHEVKELVKRRKHFEYKIQKRTKKKEDFLSYIQYERNLKNLIDIRRSNIRYFHKKDVIDNAINKRIHKMFIILCNRWQSDKKLWLSHIDWLKEIKWNISVSKAYMFLLQVHNSDPKLWIAAAKFEFETGSADNGRQVMLRGLRFHSKSKLLHREYVKFELLFVEKLVARKKILKIEEDNVEEKADKEDSDGDEEVKEHEEGEKESKKAKKKSEDEVEDKILNCDLVNLVIQSALESIPEPGFAVSLLTVCRLFPAFAAKVENNILDILRDRFAGHPVTVDTLARLELEKEGKTKDLVLNCLSVYREALSAGPPTAGLVHAAFTTVTELAKKTRSCTVTLFKFLLELLEVGDSNDLLDADQYEFYFRLVQDDGDGAEESDGELLSRALAKFPADLRLWNVRLESALRSPSESGYKRVMKEANEALSHEDKAKFWHTFMDLMNKKGRSDEAYSYLEESAGQLNLGFLRVLFLDRSYEKGVDIAREVYNRFNLLPPFCKEFHKNMLVFELEQKKVDKARIRAVYQVLSNQFGSEDIQVWLDWISWEETSGRVLEVPNVVCRAEAALNGSPDLLNKFTALREMSAS